MSGLRLALLDRDGTLNRKAPEGEYVTSLSDLEVLPGAARAVRRLNDAGVAVAVVTNQRAVALGRLGLPTLDAIHDRLQAELVRQAGAHVDAFFVCPHDVGVCACRKPAPGLLARAARVLRAQPEQTVMIGDSAGDVEAGRRFGARTIQLTDGPSAAGMTAADLAAAVELALEAPVAVAR